MKLDFESIERQDSLSKLRDQLGRVLNTAGISFFIYITVDPDRSNPFLMTNMPSLYNGPGPAVDPFIEHCCTSYEPTLTGFEHISEHPYLSDTEINFIRRAAEVEGFRSGVGLPVRLQGSDRFGGFNFGTGLTRRQFERWVVPIIPDLQVFALIAHRRIEELSSESPQEAWDFRKLLLSDPEQKVTALTPREKEVLFLISKGFTTKEIARLCSISPHTAGDYRKSIYKKLSVSNAAAAATEASQLGLI